MVMHLGAGLLLPRPARNALLRAAGFTPVFPTSPLQSDALLPFRQILNDMIERHAPNPALLVDRHWNVQETNATARTLLSALAGGGEETNLIRMLTAGDHIADVIANLPEVLREMTSRLELEALEAGDDAVLADLLKSLERASTRYPLAETRGRGPIVPLVLNAPDGQLRFLSAIAHFGASEDITVRDLRLELLFPADDHTRAAMEAAASA